MKKVLKRLQSKTPDFFKRVQLVGGSMATLCIGISKISGISEKLSTLAVNGIIAGGVMILVAQFAVDSSAPIK